jgi:Leucine-rich repeat (LRR) protein
VWGGGQQADGASITSGGSKYRDLEGERLLTLANERVKIDNMAALDKEFGQSDDDAAEEDYDSQLRRRVFLDRDGTMGYDNNGATESLSVRRMRKTCLRTMKRPVVLICAVGIAIAMVSGSMTLYNKFMTKDSGVPMIEGESEHNSNNEVAEIPPVEIPPPSGAEGFTELEVDGVKIDVDKERFDHIRYIILDSQVSTPAAIQDTKSAQFAALLWLVREDPRHLDPDSAYLLQRYGLAVLWFSTTKSNYYHVSEEYTSTEKGNGRKLEGHDMDKWFQHDDWLSGLGVCGWLGVKCYPHDDGIDHDGNNDGDVMSIDLRRNNLRGAFPSDIFRTLKFLKSLDLSNNALAGTISEDIGKLSDLEYFNFTANNIVGSLPDSIGDLSSLNVFHMSFNHLDNTIPYSIYKLEKLRDLDLSRNSLAATIPREIGALKQLTSLNLAFNSLEGPLPHELNNMQSLVELDLSHNKLQSSLPNEIGLVTYLRSLNLSHNNFGGNLPKVIGNLEHLDELYLNDNEFKGNIPTELSKLAELDVLNLANNHFTGVFPTWLTQLYGLKELDISNNAIKGEIPRSIEDMKSLKILNLSNNDIVGLIPQELGILFKLEQISLDTNELVGGVPDQLGELKSLRKLALHNNFLTGHVSAHLCSLKNDMFLTQFSVDCAGETAVILCECCQCHLHENIIHLNDGNNR